MTEKYDAMFSGVIGQDYDMLNLICPLAIKMSILVGDTLKNFAATKTEKLNVLELGGGTGITTLALLNASENTHILSIDNEPVMLNQAKENLNAWVEKGQISFSENDALTALKALSDNSVDAIASAYTLHNFLNSYRADVVIEMFRVLKSGGQFINGDRYALDDISHHTRVIQAEVAEYFRILIAENKLDLLQHWIIHLFNDESENHVMRETVALEQLKNIGFKNVTLTHRTAVNALVTATKP
jgi:ubiquinone/menaquinone biosynthesis C-methylase UbiE